MFNFLRKKEDVVAVKTYTVEEYESLQKNLFESHAACKEIISQRDELKTLVREQTEADLLINALKGLGIIQKPIQYDTFAERNRLLALQQQAQSMNRSIPYQTYSGLAGFGRLWE